MGALILCLVGLVAGSVGLGVALHRHPVALSGGPPQWGVRAVDRYGALGGPIAVFVGGVAATLAVGVPLGFMAKALEQAVDQPVFEWVYPRVQRGASTTLNEKL